METSHTIADVISVDRDVINSLVVNARYRLFAWTRSNFTAINNLNNVS